MVRDLFAAPINGHKYVKSVDEFRWVVGIFSGNGAVEVIKRANGLKTFYPIRRNIKGEYVPLWRPYLFIQFEEGVTINLCRTTNRSITVISERDDAGLVRPVLIRKDAINESLRLMTQGKFDDVIFQRRTYGKGAIVRVIEGNFIDQKVRLEADILPEMKGNYKVPVDINGIKAKIAIFKLAL